VLLVGSFLSDPAIIHLQSSFYASDCRRSLAHPMGEGGGEGHAIVNPPSSIFVFRTGIPLSIKGMIVKGMIVKGMIVKGMIVKGMGEPG
jgi:hypothetical protein